MKVSIVIPCKNEEKYIEKCINSFINSTFDINQVEILVVDGNSTDKTREIVTRINQQYPQIKIIDNPKEKTPFALNIGIQQASGEYILIASAHSSFDNDYIEKIIAYFDTLQADVIGGVMETKVLNKTPKTNSIIEVLSNKFGVGNASFRVGIKHPEKVDTVPFGIYKRKLLLEIGGYDERLIRNHDIEMSKRLLKRNKVIFLVPKPKCYYYARETYSEIFKNNYRNGKWNIITVYITKLFSSLSLRHFIPLIFVSSLLLPLLGAILYPPLAFLSLFSALAYLLLITTISFQIKNNNNSTQIRYLIFAFITLHFSYGLGSIVGLFSIKHLNQ